jgi:hypothetical protein
MTGIDPAQFIEALAGVELDERLFYKLLQHSARADGTLKPEGRVRVSWIAKFISDYGYSSKQIDIEVPAGRIGRAAEYGSDTVFAAMESASLCVRMKS